MPHKTYDLDGRYYRVWEVPGFFDEATRLQIEQVARLPFVRPYVAVMPDAHAGKGSCVGCVIPTQGIIMPAAVGVDIGCGMLAVQLPISKSDLLRDVEPIYSVLSESIPMGKTFEKDSDKGAWNKPENVPQHIAEAWASLAENFIYLCEDTPELINSNTWNHMGTLGTGNHFLELSTDENDRVWLVIHSGSRGVGNRIGGVFLKKTQEDLKKRYINISHPDLAYLVEGDKLFDNYMFALAWAQEYARLNRLCMAQSVLLALGLKEEELEKHTKTTPGKISCHHNYARKESHGGKNYIITRKGAIRAGLGDWGIIPGSMGDSTFIVRGKGNPDSFCSASHGAGRAMSRTQARATFNVGDLARDTIGIMCRKDVDIIDETPGAYKPIKEVMEAQSDLVEVVHTLKQHICLKG